MEILEGCSNITELKRIRFKNLQFEKYASLKNFVFVKLALLKLVLLKDTSPNLEFLKSK
jgi:hypothetical protein